MSDNWIQLHDGQVYDYNNIPVSVDSLTIDNIASSLSKLCRFAGHVTRFISVAEHSVLVSEHVPKKMRLAALLHDASEAVLVDLPKPVKSMLPQYLAIEDLVMKSIAERYGLPWPLPVEIKLADKRMCLTEARLLLASKAAGWGWSVKPYRDVTGVIGLGPEAAKLMFLTVYKTITR